MQKKQRREPKAPAKRLKRQQKPHQGNRVSRSGGPGTSSESRGPPKPSLDQMMHASAGSRQHCATPRSVPKPGRVTKPLNAYRAAGPSEPVPNYDALDSQPLNRLVMALFRGKMVDAIGQDSQLEG